MEKVTTVSFEGIEEINITPVKRRNLGMPKYNCFGERYQEVIISGLNKPAGEMLSKLVERRDIKTNMAVYRVEGTTAKCQLTIAFKDLKNKDLVIRVKKQHYMINPSAVFPRFDRYYELKQIWEELKSGSVK